MQTPKYNTAQLVSYASLATPMQILMIPLIVFLPPFYAAEGGLGMATVGAVFFFARVWDAVSDPIVGALSDRTKSKYGRRKPWIVLGTPLLMLLTWFLLVPGDEVGVVRLGFMIFFFYVVWTIVYIPFQSWGAEISSDYDERGKIAAFREGFSVFGIVVGMGVPLLLIDPSTQGIRDVIWPDGLPLDSSLRSLLLIMAVTLLILLPLTSFAATYFFPSSTHIKKSTPTLEQTLKVIKRNTIFRRLFFGYFFAQFGWLIYLSVVQLYITRALEIEAHILLVFIQHIVAVVLVPAWAIVAKKFGKHRAYCASLFILATGVIMLGFLQPHDITGAIMVSAYLGIGAGGKLMLPSAMAADTVDYDTMKTGHQEAGTHLALLNLANKATFAASIGFVYPLLALAGFDPTIENPPDAIMALRIITVTFPVTVMAIGVFIMWNFPLTRKRQHIIQRYLDRQTARNAEA